MALGVGFPCLAWARKAVITGMALASRVLEIKTRTT
jgi:hypothetical protein